MSRLIPRKAAVIPAIRNKELFFKVKRLEQIQQQRKAEIRAAGTELFQNPILKEIIPIPPESKAEVIETDIK